MKGVMRYSLIVPKRPFSEARFDVEFVEKEGKDSIIEFYFETLLPWQLEGAYISDNLRNKKISLEEAKSIQSQVAAKKEAEWKASAEYQRLKKIWEANN